jgi:hypothetical protein
MGQLLVVCMVHVLYGHDAMRSEALVPNGMAQASQCWSSSGLNGLTRFTSVKKSGNKGGPREGQMNRPELLGL